MLRPAEVQQMAADLNAEGKRLYASQLAKKVETTTTVLDPKGSQPEPNKMQRKAYRSNQPSQTSYVEPVREVKSLLNFQPAEFNIITMRDESKRVAERRPMTAIQAGKCKSQHPLSKFQQVTRLTAPNLSQDYQRAITAQETAFRRTNGPFTHWFDSINTQKFISVPFKERPQTVMANRSPLS